jgi:DMSO/TMAO reductase YedYZ molybdopterin-dependent catalytic subunit
MDSTRVNVGESPKKLQGVALGEVLGAMEPRSDAETALIHTGEGTVSLRLEEVLVDDDLRLFTLIGEEEVTFVLALMNGEVLAAQVISIEVE